MHEDEESAARQYDRALLIEKGRAAKTNFPLPDYEKEAKEFETFVIERYELLLHPAVPIIVVHCCISMEFYLTGYQSTDAQCINHSTRTLVTNSCPTSCLMWLPEPFVCQH